MQPFAELPHQGSQEHRGRYAGERICPSGCPQPQRVAHVWGLKLSQLNPSHIT